MVIDLKKYKEKRAQDHMVVRCGNPKDYEEDGDDDRFCDACGCWTDPSMCDDCGEE